MKSRSAASAVALCFFGVGCAGPYAGPDKQFAGSLQGAAVGAGGGAVTGFQLGAGTGPGALVGAGLGAVAGGIQGFAHDRMEENMLALANETREERKRAIVHEILTDQYKRRMELHPTREIYPADLFFSGDDVKLKPGGAAIVRELAQLNKTRLAWSRLVIASYVRSRPSTVVNVDTGVEASAPESAYAKHLSEGRARELVDYFVRSGIEPRRLQTRSVVMSEPILVDPDDAPGRYNQAIEIIPLDR